MREVAIFLSYRTSLSSLYLGLVSSRDNDESLIMITMTGALFAHDDR
jgi:hypothetical protein